MVNLDVAINFAALITSYSWIVAFIVIKSSSSLQIAKDWIALVCWIVLRSIAKSVRLDWRWKIIILEIIEGKTVPTTPWNRRVCLRVSYV